MSKKRKDSGAVTGGEAAGATPESAGATEATPQATLDATIDATLDAIRAASLSRGTSVERGHFRLDWSRALDKIKRFQLTDPHRYVLEIVQAAVAGGATKIDVTTDADDVIVRYDSPGPGADELARLFDYLFAQAHEQIPLRQLALGVNAALALGPRFITVDSGDGARAHRLRLTSHTDATVAPLAGEEVLLGTRVHVRERVSFHTLADLVLRRCAEAEHLAAACGFAPIPILVDGGSIQKQLAADALVSVPVHMDIDLGKLRGELALLPEVRHTALLKVYMNGVEIVTHELLEPELPPFVGYVDHPALSRNASHTDVHRDHAYQQLIDAVRRAGKQLLTAWLRRRFGAPPGTDPGPASAAKDSPKDDLKAEPKDELDRHYLRASARAFLRGRPDPLPPELEALLDVADMVELALVEPAMSSLRPIYESFRDHGTCHVASGRYAVSLVDLPEGMVPVRSTSWVLDALIEPSARVEVDELMRTYKRGMEKRREAELSRREAVLLPSEALIKVAVTSPAKQAHRIQGQVGLIHLDEAAAQWQRGLDVVRKDTGQVRIIFLRDGVPLGERVVTAPMTAVAVVESADFAPTPAWDGIQENRASSAAMRLVSGAAGELAPALATEIGELPPAPSLMKAGFFAAATATFHADDELSGSWPLDTAALAARAHADEILAHLRSLPKDPSSWLWQWRMFHTLSGQAVCLAEIAGHGRTAPTEPTKGEPAAWGYVLCQPWGSDAPDDMKLLNISREQKSLLKRLIPDLPDRSADLTRHREALEKRIRQEERRRQNLEAAELRRQAPVLPADAYAAVIDLAVPDGTGQAGIPRAELGSSPRGWIRVLIGDLPLTDLPLSGAIPIHAVVASSRYAADASFETVSPLSNIDEIRSLVLAHMGDLMAAFVASEAAKTPPGYALFWKYLETVPVSEREPLKAVPKILVDLPLVETVDRGRIPLRAVAADAAENGGRVLVTDIAASAQLQKRPILRVGEAEQRTLRRLLGIKLHSYTGALREEQAALDKLHGRRQEPVLTGATALKVAFADDTVRGELAFPHRTLGTSAGAARGEVNRVTVLHQGIWLESRPLDLDGLPLVAVVESAAFQPNRTFSAVMRGGGWTRAQKALQNAANKLIVMACEQSHERGFASLEAAQVAEALRVLCGQKFLAKPSLPGEDPVQRALASALLWSTAGGESERVSLAEIGRQWQATGVVWVVDTEERGHVAPGRIIVRGSESTVDALKQIFGTAVRYGSAVLRRDDAAYQRRQHAPELSATVPVTKVMEPIIELDQAGPKASDKDSELHMRGQVALRGAYADGDRGLVVEVGVDGRRLCERVIVHPLAGLGRLDCTGLIVSRDWDSVGNARQAAAIDAGASAALWQAALGRITAPETAGELCADAPAARHLAALVTDVLVALLRERDREQGVDMDESLAERMREAVLALPLHRTVKGQRMSSRALLDHSAAHGQVLVVSESVAGSDPAHGDRLIIQADKQGLRALEALLGSAAHRYDDAYARELAGQRRRRELPQVEPALGDGIAVFRHFSRGATSGMIGLCLPRPGSPEAPILDDQADPPSRVRVHINRRHVCDRTVTVHPAVEIWLNDDRLTPSTDFLDLARDSVYEEALAAALAELPELVARAAESCAGVEDMRLRLCHYALSRRNALTAQANARRKGPEARLLAAPLWPCLTEEGERVMTTAEILDAHAGGELATVDRDIAGHAAGSGVIAARACPRTRALLAATLGNIRDATQAVLGMEARRLFLGRPPVAAITVEAAFPALRPLWRHALTEPGWEGEIVIPDQPGHDVEVAIFADHRAIMTTKISAPMEALVAAQWSGLTVGPAWDQIERDAAFTEFTGVIRRAVCAAYAELARGITQLSAPRRRRAALIILDTLATAKDAGADPALRRMIDALLQVPLIAMTTGEIWPVAAIRDHGRDRPLAVVTPETAAQGPSLSEGPIAICDADTRHWLAELVRIEAFDQAYLTGVHAHKRRARAETSYKRPRAVIAAAELGPAGSQDSSAESGELGLPHGTSGWLALTTDLRPERVDAAGELALFSRGYLVERRQVPYPGLIGYADGPFATDAEFTTIVLERAHERAFRQIYDQKLLMAVALARTASSSMSASSPAGTWQALRAYVLLYIQRHLPELSAALAKTRDPDPMGVGQDARHSAPATLRPALTCPVLALGDGTFTDLATVLRAAGERPVVLVAARPRRPAQDAVMVIAEPGGLEAAVLTALCGKRQVLTEEAWQVQRAKEPSKRGRKQPSGDRRAGAHAMDDEHVLAALKAALRELAKRAPITGFGQSDIAAITCEESGTGDLIVGMSGPEAAKDSARGTVMSTSHPIWQAVRGRIRHDPRAIWHLAAAALASLPAAGVKLDAGGIIAQLGAMAELAADAGLLSAPAP